jgi:hypothetical protein
MVYLPIPWSERNYRGQTNQDTSACGVAALSAPAQSKPTLDSCFVHRRPFCFFLKPSLQGAILKLSWQAAILCRQSPLQVVKQISTILQAIILFPVDPDPAFQNVPGSDSILFKNLFEI